MLMYILVCSGTLQCAQVHCSVLQSHLLHILGFELFDTLVQGWSPSVEELVTMALPAQPDPGAPSGPGVGRV